MLSKTGLLIILIISSLFLMMKNVTVWTNNNPSVSRDKEQQAFNLPDVTHFFDKNPKPLSSYESLVSQNLFLQERREIILEEKKPTEELQSAPVSATETETEPEPTVQEVKIKGTTIILHGIIFFDDFKSALITNPVKQDDDDRDNKWVEVGDKLANISVDAIEPDRIILRDKNQRLTVLLHDASKPKEMRSIKEANNTLQPTVISTASAPKKPEKSTSKSSQATVKNSEDEYIIVQTPFGPQKKKK